MPATGNASLPTLTPSPTFTPCRRCSSSTAWLVAEIGLPSISRWARAARPTSRSSMPSTTRSVPHVGARQRDDAGDRLDLPHDIRRDVGVGVREDQAFELAGYRPPLTISVGADRLDRHAQRARVRCRERRQDNGREHRHGDADRGDQRLGRCGTGVRGRIAGIFLTGWRCLPSVVPECILRISGKRSCAPSVEH